MNQANKNCEIIQALFDQQLADLNTIDYLQDKKKKQGRKVSNETLNQLKIIQDAYNNRADMIKQLDESIFIEIGVVEDLTIRELKAK